MKNTIDKKLVKTTAKAKLLAGLTKQEVYDELVNEFQYRKEVADILRNIPTETRWNKYGIYNHIFGAFLVLVTLLMFLQPSGALFCMAWLIYVVFTKKFNQYYWSIVVGATGLSLMIMLGVYQGTLSILMIMFSLVFSSLFILPGIYLPKLIAPPYKEEKEVYSNDEGKSRLRVIHKFSE